MIDFQSFPDGDFKFLLVYQDHGAKLPCLEAIKKKTGVNVARKLVDIFSLLGPPCILQACVLVIWAHMLSSSTCLFSATRFFSVI